MSKPHNRSPLATWFLQEVRHERANGGIGTAARPDPEDHPLLGSGARSKTDGAVCATEGVVAAPRGSSASSPATSGRSSCTRTPEKRCLRTC